MAQGKMAKIFIYIPLQQKMALDRFKRAGIPYSHFISEAIRLHLEAIMNDKIQAVDYQRLTEELNA